MIKIHVFNFLEKYKHSFKIKIFAHLCAGEKYEKYMNIALSKCHIKRVCH